MPNSAYDKQQNKALLFIEACKINWNWTDQEIANYVSQFTDNPQTKVVLSFLNYNKKELNQ